MDATQPNGPHIPLTAQQILALRPKPQPLITLSEEEQDRRMALARDVVAAMEAIEDDSEEDDMEFLRLLDESHPGGLNLKKYYTNGPDPA